MQSASLRVTQNILCKNTQILAGVTCFHSRRYYRLKIYEDSCAQSYHTSAQICNSSIFLGHPDKLIYKLTKFRSDINVFTLSKNINAPCKLFM